MAEPASEDRALKLALAAVTLAFAAVVWPMAGALMWAAIIALLFAPMQRRLVRRWPGRAGWAALATLSVVTLTLVLPLLLLLAALGRQVTRLAADVRDGRIDPLAWFGRLVDALPAPARDLLQRYGLADAASIREHLEDGAGGAARLFAGQAGASDRARST